MSDSTQQDQNKKVPPKDGARSLELRLLKQQMETAQRQLEALLHQAKDAPPEVDASFYVALTELSSALREVYVTSEELTQQNEELINTRQPVEAERLTEHRKNQEALQKSEAFNQSVLDSLSAHIAVLDNNGTIIAINKAWERFAVENGTLSAESTGIGANYLAASDGVGGESSADAQAANEGIRAVMDGQRSHFRLEYPCHLPTAKCWYLLNVAPMVGEAGDVVVSHTDITERKLAEEALRTSEMHNRALLEAIPDAILHLRADGTLLDIKAATNAPMLYDPAQAIGQNQYDLQSPELAQVFQQRNHKLLETGALQTLEFEIQIDGEKRTRESRAVPIGEDEIIAIVRDITESKEQEEALRRSEARNRTLLEALPDPITRIHQDGTILDLILPTDFDLGVAIEDVIGKKLEELTSQLQHNPVLVSLVEPTMQHVAWVLERGELQTFEQRISVNGETQISEVRVVPESAHEVIAILRDVTERKRQEEELRRSEARNRALLEAIPDAIAHIHRDGTVLDVKAHSNVPLLFWGVEAIGKNQRDLLPPEVAHRLSQRNYRALETGSLQTLDYEIELANETRIRESRAVPVGEDEVITIVRDITERKQQEEALRRSEARNRAILQAIPDSIGRIHRDGTALDIKLPKDFELRVPIEEMIGRKQHDFLPPELAQQTMHCVEQALETGELQEFVYEVEVNGEIHSREARMVPDTDDEVISIIRDVTERRRANEALRQSEARNRALLEAIPDAIMRINRKGIYLDIKAPVEFTPTTSMDQMVGKHQSDILPPDLARKVLFYNDRAFETRQPQTFEYEIESEGETHMRESRVVPSGDDEVTIIVRDVTERTRAQAEERRLLAEVQSQSEQLRALHQRLAETQEVERRELARELHDQVGQNLSTLGLNLNVVQGQVTADLPHAGQIRGLLADSRDLLKQTTERVRNVMAELRPPMLDDFGLYPALGWYVERVAQRVGFTVDVDIPEVSLLLPSAVENALFRITQEAMTNIMKHAKATHVQVRLQDHDDTICLTITDDGHGFDLTELDDSSARKSWGLLTMRERAEAVGGRFTIKSQNGSGTTIKIEIDQ